MADAKSKTKVYYFPDRLDARIESRKYTECTDIPGGSYLCTKSLRKLVVEDGQIKGLLRHGFPNDEPQPLPNFIYTPIYSEKVPKTLLITFKCGSGEIPQVYFLKYEDGKLSEKQFREFSELLDANYKDREWFI